MISKTDIVKRIVNVRILSSQIRQDSGEYVLYQLPRDPELFIRDGSVVFLGGRMHYVQTSTGITLQSIVVDGELRLKLDEDFGNISVVKTIYLPVDGYDKKIEIFREEAYRDVVLTSFLGKKDYFVKHASGERLLRAPSCKPCNAAHVARRVSLWEAAMADCRIRRAAALLLEGRYLR